MNPEPRIQAPRNPHTGGRRIATGIALLATAACLSIAGLAHVANPDPTAGSPAAATTTELHSRGPQSSEQVLVHLHQSAADDVASSSELP